jgi:outer membrane protein assembly factor BamB
MFAVYKYSPGGGLVWKFLSSYVLHSTPVIDEKRRVLYFGGNDGRLISLSLTTGDPVGCFTAGDAISSSPALLPDGSVVFAAVGGGYIRT